MKRLTHFAVFAAISIAVSACTGQSGTSSTAPTAPTPPPAATSPAPAPTVMSVTVSGVAAVGSFQLAAVAERSDHTSENATAGAIWASSNSRIASVAAGGWVTVFADGAVDFAATYEGVTGTVHAAVSLPKLYSVSGIVTDAATSAPVANVRVQLLEADSRATTDSNGKYVLLNVPSGRNLVEFAATGYDVNEKDVTIDGDTTLSVALAAAAAQSTP